MKHLVFQDLTYIFLFRMCLIGTYTVYLAAKQFKFEHPWPNLASYLLIYYNIHKRYIQCSFKLHAFSLPRQNEIQSKTFKTKCNADLCTVQNIFYKVKKEQKQTKVAAKIQKSCQHLYSSIWKKMLDSLCKNWEITI